MPERVIIESESGLEICGSIIWNLGYLLLYVPIRLVVDLIRERRR